MSFHLQLLVRSTPNNIVGILLVGYIIAIFHISHCDSATLSFTLFKSECHGTQYAENSTFQANLNTLLSTMNNSSLSMNFYNGSVGEEGGRDRVYGLYFCTGDLPQDECQNCILQATSDVLQECPTDKEGIVWYDYCELHYSNQSFFGMKNTNGQGFYNVKLYPPGSSEPLKLMTTLVEAAPFEQPLMFASAVDETNSRYGMAQCSSDLDSTTCYECLLIIFGRITDCCSSYSGWRYLTPSCWIRFEIYAFLTNINASTPIENHLCSNDDFPSEKRTEFTTNLNHLFSSLHANGSETGFYNTSVGTNTAADAVHGLVLCRGDLNSTSTTCQDCLDQSTKNISQFCPNKTNGVVWYENCLLRYSDQSFFGVVDYDGRTYCNQNVTTEDADVAIVGLMTRLIEVATNQQPLMYAAGNVSINSANSSIYGQLQCTRDLSSESCKNCLNFGLTNGSSNCKLRNGWRYLSGSCILRYEDFLFFDPTIPAPLLSQSDTEGNHSDRVITIGILASINGVLLVGFIFYIWRKRRNNGQRKNLMVPLTQSNESFRWMDINTIRRVTNNFSHTNKLGEGGFGPVYKGTLPDGKEIAIKRLANASIQGSEEFKNEVQLIWKLQHRNLVKLLGCCTDGEEKLLVYEYLRNGSLDKFIFDPEKRSLWDWKTLTDIIFGIARGLIYLHEDSQLKVIHRDMKPSNILLDHNMNPKISDFGMARIFNGETEVKTHKVVGTYGYLAPEFAMAGVFSAKSDVFSFGVILLEIICGRKNSSLYFTEKGHSLLSQAWSLWSKGRGTEFVDSIIIDHNLFPLNQIMRFYNIGLLCVQENTTDRPSMSMVLLMLKSEQILLPQPMRPPSVFMHDDGCTAENQLRTLNGENPSSSNELTISNVDGR